MSRLSLRKRAEDIERKFDEADRRGNNAMQVLKHSHDAVGKKEIQRESSPLCVWAGHTEVEGELNPAVLHPKQ